MQMENFWPRSIIAPDTVPYLFTVFIIFSVGSEVSP